MSVRTSPSRTLASSWIGAAAVMLVAAVTASCSGGTSPSAEDVTTPSEEAAEFISTFTEGVGVDYDPFMSPESAVETADLVVEGRVASVSEGISISTPEGLWDQRTTVVVAVEEIIKGRDEAGEIIVQISRAPFVELDGVDEVIPGGLATFILEDISDWTPFPDAVISYPNGLSDETPIYSPYSDGMWFATDDVPVGYFATFEEISDRWGGVNDYESLTDSLRSAAAVTG